MLNGIVSEKYLLENRMKKDNTSSRYMYQVGGCEGQELLVTGVCEYENDGNC